jgi:hypothetical protein
MTATLCIDVGGSRIRAAVLDATESLASLRRKKVASVRSLGWLNRTLPQIVAPSNTASITARIDDPYEAIAVAVPGTVRDGIFMRTDLGIPRDLAEALAHASGMKTFVMNDAEAWATGSVEFAALRGDGFELPAFVLVLGTGVGCAVALDERRTLAVELSEWPLPFPQLESAAGRSIDESWQAHAMVGHPFVEWVASNKAQWSFERVRREYTRRLAALLEDLAPELSRQHGEIRTLVIGGGNADLVDARALTFASKVAIWSRASVDVDPDWIPLIGLRRAAHRSS